MEHQSISLRKPNWLKVKAPGGAGYVEVRRLMRELKLHTVCEEAHCPNVGECWNHRAATFLIMGDVCTRNCAYCAVAHGAPLPLDAEEPRRLAEAVEAMALRHVVVTSVDRDDVPDGGAAHYAAVVHEIRLRMAETTVELLIPDFKGNEDALRTVVEARPDILNHNLETVPRLYRMARPGGRYDRALELLARAKRMDPLQVTKSGIMVGQYLRPSAEHMPVARYYTPDEFVELARIGGALGFRHTESGPLVRSSYHAWEQAERAGALAQV